MEGLKRTTRIARKVPACPPDTHSLRCVSSGYLTDGCSCRATIPCEVAEGAWACVLQASHLREDRLFRFVWEGGVWLAFGLRDGRIRGVYCPAHSAARAQRSGVPVGGAHPATAPLALTA
jgi:hypothetical protein